MRKMGRAGVLWSAFFAGASPAMAGQQQGIRNNSIKHAIVIKLFNGSMIRCFYHGN